VAGGLAAFSAENHKRATTQGIPNGQ
jgi:hypothetical protein